MPKCSKVTFLSAIFSAFIFTGIIAQKKQDHCEICKDGFHNEPSPYELNFRNEVPFIATSALSLTAGFIAQFTNNENFLNINEINQLDREGIFFLDRSSVNNNSSKAASYSDFFRTSITLLPIYFVSNHHTKEDIWPLVTMSLEVLTTTYGLTNVSKNVVRRPRPFTYNPEVALEKKLKLDAKRSFFSGHASHTAAFTFFMAKVVSDYHPNMKKGLKTLMWSGAILIPATTSYLRVKAGKHFPTDVIAGYAAGAFVGYIIPHLHKKKEEDPVISVKPIVWVDYAGLSINFNLRNQRGK